ncbi:MAG: hypothetical protein FWC00_05080 [Firmicutes bacterium]|nr:hypothetical protein [Bacillota bacterium]
MKNRIVVYDKKLATIDTNIFWQSNITEEGFYEASVYTTLKMTAKKLKNILQNVDYPYREHLMECLDRKILVHAGFTNFANDTDGIKLPKATDIYLTGIRNLSKIGPLLPNLLSVSAEELKEDQFEYLFAHFTKQTRRLSTIGFEYHGMLPPTEDYKGGPIVGISLNHPKILKLEKPEVNQELTEIVNEGL